MALLHPVLERGEHVESIRAVATRAMRHARHHEESMRVLHFLQAAESLHHRLVVLRADAGRNLRIGPAVVLDELAAATEVRAQIRIQRVHGIGVLCLGARRIPIEPEHGRRPVRIAVHDVAVMIHRGGERRGPSPGGPAQLAAWIQPGDGSPGGRIRGR